jgi:hypothetical protein
LDENGFCVADFGAHLSHILISAFVGHVKQRFGGLFAAETEYLAGFGRHGRGVIAGALSLTSFHVPPGLGMQRSAALKERRSA